MGLFFKSSKKKETFENSYDMDKVVLGTGNFATVKKCKDKKSGAVYAVKIIDKAKVDNMIDIRVRFLDPVPVHAWLRGR